MMDPIQPGDDEATRTAKARWFRSLTMEERFDVLCQWYAREVEKNPEILHREKNFPHSQGKVLVLSLPKEH